MFLTRPVLIISINSSPFHTNTNDSSLHYFFPFLFKRHLTQCPLIDYGRVTLKHIISDLLSFVWDRKNIDIFNTLKSQFLYIFTLHNLSNNWFLLVKHITQTFGSSPYYSWCFLKRLLWNWVLWVTFKIFFTPSQLLNFNRVVFSRVQSLLHTSDIFP